MSTVLPKDKSYTLELGDQPLVIKTGELAQQANASVICQMGDTVCMSNCTISSKEREGVDFLPLQVVYQEKYYAGGSIAGSRFRPWMMRFGFMPPHPSIFCRRELFERLGYYRTDYRIAADHELMVRFLWKARIRTAYLPEAIIAMRTGGTSTRSMGARWLACRENVRACRENGIYANLPMQLAKYAVKVFQYF